MMRKYTVLRASVVAVQVALATMAVVPVAYAAESEEVLALIQPTNKVEIGVGTVDKGSYKFGEYNGLDKKGGYVNGAIDIRGGGNDGESATRWRIQGTDLGLHTRTLGAEFGEQGKFRINMGYDEIERNQYDDYKTPYSGAGSQTLTLPGYPAARTTTTGLYNWNSLQSPYATAACATTGGVPTAACQGPGYRISSLMQGFDVGTLRKKENIDLSVILSPGWQVKFSARHDDKEGSKLTGVAPGTRQGVLLPEPINHDTNQFKANLSYIDANSNLDLGYYGSIFKNQIKSWSVANPFASTLLDPLFADSARLFGAPSNEMQRLNLTGGYNFAKTTRLVVSGYYQRMTQNEAFQGSFPATWTVPETSANAKVINKSLNTILTMRPLKELSLLASYKYEDRDNQTPSRTFTTAWADGVFSANRNSFTNEPLQRRMQQINLEGDYQLAARQAVKVGYEWQEIKRTANTSVSQALLDLNKAAFAAVGIADATAESPWKSEKTKENTLKLEYRNNLSQVVTGRIAYDYSQRRSNYEDNESLATPPINPPTLASATPATVYFPAADPLLPGFRQFYLADRNRDKLRGSVNYQATDAMALQGGVAYNKDDFNNSPYGLKNTNSWVLNLDATYAPSETVALNAFYTYESKKSQLDSLAISRGTNSTPLTAPHTPGNCTGYVVAGGNLPADWYTDPCRQWSEVQEDHINTIGLGFKSAGLMSGKFDLDGDLSYSRSRTPISVTGGAYFGNGVTVAGAINNVWVGATSFPDITSEVISLRLGGKYTLDKTSAVRLNYQFSHLKSSDWQWDNYNSTPNAPNLSYAVAIPAYIGTGISSPHYTVNVFGVTYIYSFR